MVSATYGISTAYVAPATTLATGNGAPVSRMRIVPRSGPTAPASRSDVARSTAVLRIRCRTRVVLRRSEASADGPSNAITGTKRANSTIAATATGDSTTVTVRIPTRADAIRKAPSNGFQRARASR